MSKKFCFKCGRVYKGKKGDAGICPDCLLSEQIQLRKEFKKKKQGLTPCTKT